jgi:hypothetical protein
MIRIPLILLIVLYFSAFPLWLSFCSNNYLDSYGPGSYIYGVRFTPPQNTGLINIVSVFCRGNLQGSVFGGPPFFNISLWHVLYGYPTTLITSKQMGFPSGDYGVKTWRNFHFDVEWSGGSETEFAIGVQPLHTQTGSASWWNSILYSDDHLDAPNRSWQYDTSTSSWSLMNGSGDLMIKVGICLVGVDPSSVGRIKSSFH